MSAICGLINFDGAPIDPNLLRKMAEAGVHHGPDGIRYWIEGNVGIAHLAFNTTPASVRERQPLLSADGNLCLTADARVDNQPELIANLSTMGTSVNQNVTDADLILAAYQCWGESCPTHLIGDFAFAIWDKKQQRLFCARDVFGMKPLVYSRQASFFCFASEAQQILQHPAISCQLDEISVADFLTVNNQEQSRTIFANIRNTPPAHSMLVNSTRLDQNRYWNPAQVPQLNYSHSDEYADHFGDVFQRTISDRLRTNSPTIGIQLSGGLDSSSIAVVAHKLLQERNDRELSALTLVYNELDFEDERHHSSLVAEHLGINLSLIANDGANLLTGVEQVELESPFRGWERSEKNILEHFQGLGGQVLLTGVGGDDLLGGSALVHADRLRRGDLSALGSIWKDARANNISFWKLIYSWFIRPRLPHAQQPTPLNPPWIREDFAARTNIRERLKLEPPIPSKSWARQNTYTSITQMGNVYRMYFHWHSRLAVRYLIEHRHPFLDRRLVELVLGLPPEQLWQAGFSKYILRQAMTNQLPEPIRTRLEKTSYLSVIHHRLRSGESGHISWLLERPLVVKLGFVDRQILHDVLESYLAGRQDGRTALNLIRLLSLEVWLSSHPKLIK